MGAVLKVTTAAMLVGTAVLGCGSLSSPASPAADPQWRVAFVAVPPTNEVDFPEVDGQMVSVATSGQDLVRSDRLSQIRHPRLSPDGSRIAYQSKGTAEHIGVYVSDADGTNAHRLSDGRFDERAPAWSPGGQHLAFVSRRDGNFEIYVMDADGANARRLTHDPEPDDFPDWSPDGAYIAFQSRRTGFVNIFVMRADGTDVHQLTRDQHNVSPAWSPDGKHIAYAALRDGRPDIHVMDEDGSNDRRITRGRAGNSTPRYSPDGRMIAFVSWSGRGALRQVYTIATDGSNERQLTSLPTDNLDPNWVRGKGP